MYTLVCYAASTALAIFLALLLVVLIQPGRTSSAAQIAPNGEACGDILSSGPILDTTNGGTRPPVPMPGVHSSVEGTIDAVMHANRMAVPDDIAQVAVDMNVLA